MALVDNQNDRPVPGNQIIISRMFVMILNTHWASMALSASCMGHQGATPRLSSSRRPSVLPAFSVSLVSSVVGVMGVFWRGSTKNLGSTRQLHALLVIA
jgi:hypothetical protein